MTAIPSSPAPASSPSRQRTTSPGKGSLPIRLFYPLSALLILILVVSGFHHFYFEGRAYPGRPITPPIRTLVIAHGVAMSLWLLLFAVQPFLILTRKHKVHMSLGKIGAILALAIFGLGIAIAIQSARYTPPEAQITGLSARPFMAIPFCTAFIFAGFILAGIWNRKRPALHRPLILMGTIAAAGAGISRIDLIMKPIAQTSIEYHFGVMLYPMLLALILCTAWCILIRKADRPMILATLILLTLSYATQFTARTSLWAHFTDTVLGPPSPQSPSPSSSPMSDPVFPTPDSAVPATPDGDSGSSEG